MGLLKALFIIFLLAFPVTEVGRVPLPNGVAFSLNDILLVAVILVWLGSHILKRRKFVFGKLGKPIVVFSVIGLMSLLVNLPSLGVNNLFISSLYLVRWVAYALIYVIVSEFEPKFKNKISYWLLFSGSIVIFLGYVQYFFYPNLRNLFYLGWDVHLYRMFSSFLDPNFAGAFFVLFFIFSLVLGLKHFRKKENFKSGIIFLIAITDFIAVYLTYSRSALIMLIVTVVTYLIVQRQKRLIVAAIIGLIAIIFFLPKSFTTEGTNLLRTASGVARIESLQTGVKIFQQSPILGVGFDAYRYAQHKVGLNSLYWQVIHSGAGTDNGFLFILATAGIVGLAAFLYILFSIFSLAKQNLKKNIYAVVLFSGLAGLIIDGLFVNSLFYVLILEWVWILSSLTEKS
ncbi:MAG TPA: O-antigen ligase family protein [Patescibacteria group bacterium]|jgi:O-antigen ligase|nr:O-antigen ligase family protein [Patescibacteria group bacterium]